MLNDRERNMVDSSRRTLLKLVGTGTVASAAFGAQVAASGKDDHDSKETKKRIFSAGRLTGRQEVPPVETNGEGAAVFQLAGHGAGPHIHYALLVATLRKVTQAHIHLGERNENGPIVVFLFGRKNDTGEFTSALEQGVTENGVLATGTITADDLIGPLEGQDLDKLVKAMCSEAAYVNVHTEQHPAGEIRGQLHGIKAVDVELEEEVDVKAEHELTVKKDVELDIHEKEIK